MAIVFHIKGEPFIISDEDADLLTAKWSLNVSNRGKDYEMHYAKRNIRQGKVYVRCELLHRVVLARMLSRDLAKGECADHINGDTHDNRRENLRLATYTQNAINRKTRADSKTGYKGVRKLKNERKFQAIIRFNGIPVLLGSFDTPEEAHTAYLKAARELYGDFARGE